MAKKSARSKGYRTYKKQPEGMTPKEKKMMIIAAVAVVVILICILTIPDAVEKAKYLKTKDGVVQNVGDNWLIYDMNDLNSKAYYLKIAEVGTPEGYELDRVDNGIVDEQQRLYYFNSTAEEPLAKYYYVAVGGRNYDELAEFSSSSSAMFATEVTHQSEVMTDVVGDHNVAYYTLEYETVEYDENDNETPAFMQMATMYVESPIDGTCVVISATNTGDSEEVYADRDALVESLKPFVEALVLAEAK